MAQNFDDQEYLVEKWDNVLSDERYPDIPDSKKGVIAQIFENQQRWNTTELKPRIQNIFEAGEAPYTLDGNVGGTWKGAPGNPNDPENQLPNMIMSILRRAAPRLISLDVAATVPLSQPNGYIFALRAKTDDLNTDVNATAAMRQKEILIPGQYKYNVSAPGFDEAQMTEADLVDAAKKANSKYATSEAELLGTKSFADVAAADRKTDKGFFRQVTFDLDRFPVEVSTRALGASFSVEAMQDFAATFNGLDVESELVRIMSDQISMDMNQETLRIIRRMAKPMISYSNSKFGDNTYWLMNRDISIATDANARNAYGRWIEEKIRTLMLQIENQSVQIARDTGRGLANLIITTPAVVSLLKTAGLITIAPGMMQAGAGLIVDQSYAGVLAGQYQVYVDYYFAQDGALTLPTSSTAGSVDVRDYIVIGYQGGPTDSGLFFCPYTLLNLYKAVDPYTFQNRMAFKSRYAMAQNAFDLPSPSTMATDIQVETSRYYRKFYITDLPPYPILNP